MVSKIVEAARQGYSGDFPVDPEQAKRHEVGDGLADFILLELQETLDDEAHESDQEYIDQAIDLMETAQRDIQGVIKAIQNISSGQ